jgi:hypothetical protein
MKERYKQMQKADKWYKDKTIPYYKDNKWILNDLSDTNLEKLIQNYVGINLQYHYRYNNEIIIRNTFEEILKDMLTRYKELDISGFENDYNNQQIEWLQKIKERLEEYHAKNL